MYFFSGKTMEKFDAFKVENTELEFGGFLRPLMFLPVVSKRRIQLIPGS